MRLHRLKLTNFRLHAETDIAFANGITAIVGPNGAGKTTLLEALAWAFYGTPAARGSRDSIRRSGAPARAPVRVEVELTLGAHDYRVVRHLYGAELYQDGSGGAIANSQQAVSSKMTYLLGMNREEFFNTYFTGQKEITVMSAMGPADRAKFLSRLLGYEKLRLAQDELRAQRSTLRGETSGLEQGLEDEDKLERERVEADARLARSKAALDETVEKLKDAERRAGQLGPQWEAIQQLRETTVKLQGERSIAEQQVREAKREFDRLDRDLAQALQAVDRMKELRPKIDRFNDVQQEFDKLDRASQDAVQHRLLTGQLQEVRVQLKRIMERREQLGGPELVGRARTVLDDAHRQLEQLKKQEDDLHTAWVRDKQDAETKRQALRTQYLDVQEHRDTIVGAGPEGKCPTCARELGEEFETVLTTLSSQLEEIESNGRFYSQRIKQLGTSPVDLQEVEKTRKDGAKHVEAAMQRLAEVEARVAEIDGVEVEKKALTQREQDIATALAKLADEYDAEHHEMLRQELRSLEEASKLSTELKLRAERAEQLVKEAEEAEQVLTDREKRFRLLNEEVEKTGFSEEQYKTLKTDFERAESDRRTIQLKESALQGDFKVAKTAQENVAKRSKARELQARKLKDLRRQLTLHEELDDAFDDLRRELNARMRPDLSELASGFLSDVTDGRYHELELDEQYRIRIVEDGDSKSVISGGEEDVANLVLRLAISQMVAERAGQPLSLLVLDEIFGGLDEDRRQNVVDVLRGLADRFPQVVLITHIESVKDGVDRVLRVTVDNEERIARVREEDCFGPTEDAA